MHCHAARAPSHGRLPSDQGGTAWHPEISYSPLFFCRSPRALGRALVTVRRGHSGPHRVLACSLLQATAQPSCRRPLSVAHEVRRPARERPAGPSAPPPCSPPSCPPALHIQKLPRGEATGCLVLLAKGRGPRGCDRAGKGTEGGAGASPTTHACPASTAALHGSARSRGKVSLCSKAKGGGSAGGGPLLGAGAPGCPARRRGVQLRDAAFRREGRSADVFCAGASPRSCGPGRASRARRACPSWAPAPPVRMRPRP